jgi:predicted kinase
MSARRLILVTGAPASGKSTLARRLAAQFDALSVSKDEIKELLFDLLGTGDAAWSRRLSSTSVALLFAFAQRLLARSGALFLDTNLRREQAAALRPLLADGVKLAQILCVAELDLRRSRLLERARSGSRHAGHDDARLAAEASADSDFLALPGPCWRYDGSRDTEAQYQRLAQSLSQWWTSTSSTSV